MRLAKAITLTIAMALLVWAAPSSSDSQVRIVIEPWPPFADRDLPERGFLTQLTEAAFKAAGYDPDVHFTPWARALHEVAHGHRDVVMGLFYSEEREELYRYSNAVYEAKVGLVTRQGFERTSYESMEDLAGYRIGVGRGFANSPAFDQAVRDGVLDVYVASDHATLVPMLFANRLDMVAGTVEPIMHAAQQSGHDRSELAVLAPPLKIHAVHIGVSRAIDNSEQLRDDFNQGLATIRENGTYDEIMAAYQEESR
ncbi:MAG: amino acid ABC transporter substrate-binding protein [Ectothiorhodospiraceae bacterium]|nr:amino acid ABC transporter substrate-binding protein [Ectothiorhodospiraceae bacterium]MCH8505998.1 transporter substrate-binding domain-containing protein [Ectothiorhodospiraceae bacterium]